jgi:hypothetical protein
MNWLTASVIIIGLLIWYSRKAPPARKPKPVGSMKAARLTEEKIEDLLASDDIDKMAVALDRVSDPLSRHQLLSVMMMRVYPERGDADSRKKLYRFGKIYLDEFDRLAPELQKQAAPDPMAVPAFKCLAIAMEEDRRYQEAVDICKLALKWNLDDGTKTGYAGRLARLQKKEAAQ